MSSRDPLIGKQLGDYKIISLLGKGGMARVYRGFDEKLHRAVAIKVFDAAIGGTAAEMEEYRERFSREARSIARLRHPHIVDVYRTGQVDNINYIAMMFIDGRDLRHILKEHNANNTRMKSSEILRIITDVASALDYAHVNGVIHRDVKPSNIMVMEDGHAILTDFGLALSVPEGTIGNTFGSVHYIAPEQAVSSAQAVPQSDIYSLGVVLYEMLTGKVPFDDPSIMSVALKHINDQPVPPADLNPDLAPGVSSVVLRVLEKDPYHRYHTASEMVQALEAAIGITDEDEMTRVLASEKPILGEAYAGLPAVMADSKPSSLPRDVPQPIISDSDHSKTISQSRRAALQLPPEDPPKKKRSIWGFILPIGLVLLIVGITMILSNMAGERQFNNHQMTATAVALLPEETETLTAPTDEPTTAPTVATEIPTETTEATPTLTATPRASATPTEDTPTDAPQGVAPDNEPVAEETAVVTPTPSEIDAPVLFIYDDQGFTLWNRSEEPVDVSGLVFAQIVEDGIDLTYPSNRWAVNNAPPYALPASECLQVWTFNDNTIPTPDSCLSRLAWRQVAPSREFWRAEYGATAFEVRRGTNVLVVCEISAGECAFNPKAAESR